MVKTHRATEFLTSHWEMRRFAFLAALWQRGVAYGSGGLPGIRTETIRRLLR